MSQLRNIAAVSSSSSRNRGVLLLAAVFGILSAVLIFAFLKTTDSSPTDVNNAINAGAGAESVVVLTADVPAGTKITSAMLTTKTIPAAAVLTRTSRGTARPLRGKARAARPRPGRPDFGSSQSFDHLDDHAEHAEDRHRQQDVHQDTHQSRLHFAGVEFTTRQLCVDKNASPRPRRGPARS